MGMVHLIRSKGCRKFTCHNGFVLVEFLIYAGVLLLLWHTFLPIYVLTVQQVKIAESREELARQGMLMDETLYNTLRFSDDIAVTDTQITCRDSDGLRTGFSIKKGIVYRSLDNRQEQPLTGNPPNGALDGRFIVVPYQGQPYFAIEEQTIVVHILLLDTATQTEWPCLIHVVPLKQQWEVES